MAPGRLPKLTRNANGRYTPELNLPVSGKATYSGVASHKSSDKATDGLGYPESPSTIVENPESVSRG
jgi:hypothetical protein